MLVYFILVERHPIPETMATYEDERSETESLMSPRGRPTPEKGTVDYTKAHEFFFFFFSYTW